MKRLSIIFVITLMTAIAVPGFDAGAREYSGPERGKMGVGSEGYAAIATGKIMSTFKAELSGDLIPAAARQATGEAMFEFSGVSGAGTRKYSGPERGKMGMGADGVKGVLNYKLSVLNIDNVTAAHLHLNKRATAAGPVIAPLFSGPKKAGEFSGTLSEGTIVGKDLTGPLSGRSIYDLTTLMSSGEVYVNVHADKHPAGEIRGEVKPVIK
ncbi:MAG: CHRD domain-containing protein [Nitrospirota bacterium]